jgi:hypothetical protein
VCLSFLSFNVSAFVRKLTMGIFAAAFDARESARLRPRVTKRPTHDQPHYLSTMSNIERNDEPRRSSCCAVIASETDLFSEPSAWPIAAALSSTAGATGNGGADRS